MKAEAKEIHLAKFERTLEEVAKNDFFATQLLLRKFYVPAFNLNEFNDILESIAWLKNDDNLDLFEKSSDVKNNSIVLPDYVRNNGRTIRLFFQIAKEVEKSDIYKLAVAYNPGTDAMINDLRNITDGKIKRFKLYNPSVGDARLESRYSTDDLGKLYRFFISDGVSERRESEDILGDLLFRGYWRALTDSARIIVASGNHLAYLH